MVSSSTLLRAALFAQLQGVSGAKGGIIGFGLSLYQDSCSLACHDSLSSLYLSCTTFSDHDGMTGMKEMGMEMGMTGMTTEECRTSNMPWLQTMAYCIQQACGAQGYTVEKQASCFKTHAVAGASEPTFHDCLPITAPTIELPENATWLNSTSLVNHHLYHATHGTLEEFARSEYIHTRYSIYVALNVIFSSISFGSFQPNIYFPSQQFELCEYVGNRTGTLSLVNMSIAILFAGRNNILIGITGWSQTTFLALHRWAARVATLQAIAHSIAYTVQYVDPGYDGAESYSEKAAEPFYWWGIIGTIALSLATAFAILPLRISLYESFLILHIILIILALVACWYHLVPHFGFQYGYQVWLYICFAFWSADRVARLARIVYYNRLGDAKATVEAVPGCTILRITVFPRVIRGIGPGQHTFLYFPGLGRFWESHPFSIAAWEKHRTTLQSASPSLSASKGNEAYLTAKEFAALPPATDSTLHVKSISTPHQEAVPHESQKYDDVSFQLLIRAHSGMTGTLQRYLSSHPVGSKVEISLYTEGYYAGHHATLQSLFTADTVLCLAGGLGITNALGFIQEYVSEASVEGEAAEKSHGIMRRAKRFILAWSAKEIAFIDYVKKNFLTDAQGVEYLFWHTGSSEHRQRKLETSKGEILELETPAPTENTAVTVGRMPIGSVIRSSLEIGRQTTVLVCGPGQMADEARRQVVSCVKDGFSVDLVEEAFAW
ncbi:hypothetical protein O1611_g1554 [Lasiodiplodia mahajangana]|uniref:Uncharacterized protein n=1 Tax=Lasiodiplodia mahajangana TaxID=1108764 RepID=A0ACC2JXC3_9PEZI|nr:hypothetical protein O1611_g1554 [Lasiodiplodia mahajangana]